MSRWYARVVRILALQDDESRWNDLFYLLNLRTIGAAGSAVGHLLGRVPAKLREDGFEVFVGPDSAYDLARGRFHLYEDVPVDYAFRRIEAERHAMAFEALPWLDENLARLPGATRKILVFPPLHAHALPAAGSFGEARDARCKDRITEIARRRGAMLVNWHIVSPLTTEDSNFWDPAHYRLPIA